MAWEGRGIVGICIFCCRICSFGSCSSGKLTSGAATELRGSSAAAGLLRGGEEAVGVAVVEVGD